MNLFKGTFLTLAITFSGTIFGQVNVKISGNIFNTKSDTIWISQFYGSSFKDIHPIIKDNKGNFEFEGQIPNPDYYVLKIDDSNINLILRDSSDIKIYSDGRDVAEYTNITGSPESSLMKEAVDLITDWKTKQDSALALIKQNPKKEAEINQSMQKEFSNYQTRIQGFASRNSNSAVLFPILSLIDIVTETDTYESILNQTIKGFPESNSLKEIKAQLLKIKAEKFANDPVAPGKIAPDFTEKKVDGSEMSLSDLRGNIVLLDFWASWCGPCRRENPNVVKMYHKYNKDGFTVMSVSLDKDASKWQAAIKKDGLVWENHVSDLKGWSASAGQLYGVRGIPYTVLINKEGEIIKTNVRGEELQQILQQLFGH
ncbi:MAG: redoxin family protein [Crocinitomicaceae bacterium]